MYTMKSGSRKWGWRALLAASVVSLTTLAATTHAQAGCRIDTPPAKTPQQIAQEEQNWGHWEAFDERFVRLDSLLLSNDPTYHVLMKRPGGVAHPDKPLVLFLHGFPEFARSWENWLNVIGAEHDAIAIDLKGFGESSKPTDLGSYNLFRIAFEIDAVASCLGYKKVIPVGHDWGGAFAWAYAMLFPLKTQALVALSTPHPYTYFRELADPDSLQSQRSHYIDLVRENTPQATAEFHSLMAPHVADMLQPFYAGKRANRLLQTNMANDWAWDRMFSLYRAMDLPPSPAIYNDKPNWLAQVIFKVRAPTLAVYGTADPFFVDQSWKGGEQFVPQLDFRKLEGKGHFINHQVPELPGQVLDFINRQTR